MIKKNYKNAFTIVELLVSISIIVLLMVVSIPQFRNFRSKSDLKSAAEIIQTKIYDARNYAMAPDIDKPEEVAYYAVLIDQNGVFIYEKEDITAIDTNDAMLDKYSFEGTPFSFEEDESYILFFSVDNIGRIDAITGRYGQPLEDIDVLELILISSKVEDVKLNIQTNTITGQVIINEKE